MTTYPTGYGRTLVELDDLFRIHHVDKMHPEFARRLRAWLEAQGGRIGIGGSWRPTGSQPDRPGFAPEGKSFHQSQTFASGLVAFCAVDLVARNGTNVHRAPRWDEVPAQGTPAALAAGVHCNVSSESWHMQPIEIDGWASWVAAGRPEPITRTPPPPEPPMHPTRYMLKPPPEFAGGPWFLVDDLQVSYLRGIDRDRERAAGTPELVDLADRYRYTHLQVFAGVEP